MTPTHVLREWYSPPDALIWTTWCDLNCVASDAGLTPPLVLRFERDAAGATCIDCLKTMLARRPPRITCIPLRHVRSAPILDWRDV